MADIESDYLTGRQIEGLDPVFPQDRGPWIRTYTGRRFYLLDPKPEDIFLVDIAHHLALIPRFTGAVVFPYSIAEHSWRVAREVAKTHPQFYLEALLHDAEEAYGNDLSRPIKYGTPVGQPYRDLMAPITRAIAEKFNLTASPEVHAIVKAADAVLYETERRDLLMPLAKPDNTPRPVKPLPGIIQPFGWPEAERRFAEGVRDGLIDSWSKRRK